MYVGMKELVVQWVHCSHKLLCAFYICFHRIYTYISCWCWCSSWKGPPHLMHHLQATVHLPGCCICLPTFALRACTWYNRAYSSCEEKQVQNTCRDTLSRADSHNQIFFRFNLKRDLCWTPLKSWDLEMVLTLVVIHGSLQLSLYLSCSPMI